MQILKENIVIPDKQKDTHFQKERVERAEGNHVNNKNSNT